MKSDVSLYIHHDHSIQSYQPAHKSSSLQLSSEIEWNNKQGHRYKYDLQNIKQQNRKFYRSVSDKVIIIDQINQTPNTDDSPGNKHEASFSIRCAAYCSFGLNLILHLGKAFAISSSSYTIMSSLADSCLDIIAGIIISCTSIYSKTTEEDKIKYQVGKSRISTVGILVFFFVLMSCCAIFIIMQCLNSLISHENAPPTTKTVIFIMIFTILIKFCMWHFYKRLNHPITSTLADDHRNDVFTNAFGLFMYWGGGHFYWWMDSTGGLLLSLFVLYCWSKNALENARTLLGIKAEPDLMSNLNFIANYHHPLIKTVSSVIAYQIGPGFFYWSEHCFW